METIFLRVAENKDIKPDMQVMKNIEKEADNIQKQMFDGLLLSKSKSDPLVLHVIGVYGHFLAQITDMVQDACDELNIMRITKQA